MSDQDIRKDLILREIYYSPKLGFRSLPELYKLANEEDSFTKEEIKQWLERQDTYSKFKSFNRPSFFRTTMVRYLGKQIQIDLTFLEKYNDGGYRIIYSAIEILSRYAFTVALKTKGGDELRLASKKIMERFKERFHDYPKLIQVDEGREFLSLKVQKYFKDIGTTVFSTNSERKAAIVERFNRTLKTKLKKYYETYGKWVSALPDLTENYNTQIHSSIGMKPSEVNQENQTEVWMKLYGHIMTSVKPPKFKVGDKVRVLHINPQYMGERYRKWHKKTFPKEYGPDTKHIEAQKQRMKGVGYSHPFSDEVFVVDKVLYGEPVVYKLFSPEEGIEILGKFYEQELSLIKDG